MINVKKVLSVGTLKSVAALGAGSAGADIVSEKVAGQIFKGDNAKFQPLVPLLVGIAASKSTKGGEFVKDLGKGMIANVAGGFISSQLRNAGVITGVGSTGQVMLQGGEVMLQDDVSAPAPTFNAPSFSSNGSNEMAY